MNLAVFAPHKKTKIVDIRANKFERSFDNFSAVSPASNLIIVDLTIIVLFLLLSYCFDHNRIVLTIIV